jgi:hypothetical protein
MHVLEHHGPRGTNNITRVRTYGRTDGIREKKTYQGHVYCEYVLLVPYGRTYVFTYVLTYVHSTRMAINVRTNIPWYTSGTYTHVYVLW